MPRQVKRGPVNPFNAMHGEKVERVSKTHTHYQTLALGEPS